MVQNAALTPKRLGKGSHGVFDANAWIQEGDGLVTTARSIRARWLCQRRQIRARPNRSPQPSELIALSGNPRASVLLLGYAVEMYLKAGLAQWLRHCPESLFAADTRRYGHDYARLADDLEIDASLAPRDLLEFLSKAVTLEARYPATPRQGETPIDAINRRTDDLWSGSQFKALCLLAKRLRANVRRMNVDRDHPSSMKHFEIPPGGYLVMRVGGHLPARVTVRPPDGQKWGIDEISEVLRSSRSIEVQQCWSRCVFYLDKGKNGSSQVLPGPSEP